MSAVRVFVAASRAEWLPMQVLHFSIREKTSRAVDFQAISAYERAIPTPRDLRNRARTPFSFQRFLIPELCGFEGRAIYLDADMQLFADIGALWDAPMDGHDLLTVREGVQGRKGQFSVVLMDCARLAWRVEDIVAGLDQGRYSYEELMFEMCVAQSVGRTLDPQWNSLESYSPGQTRLLHYTDMETQPWVSLSNPLGPLWVACLRRALEAGFITIEALQREAALGHVRPSLVQEATRPGLRQGDLRGLDRGFVAPYKAIRSGKARPWLSWRSGLAHYARRGVQRLLELAGR